MTIMTAWLTGLLAVADVGGVQGGGMWGAVAVGALGVVAVMMSGGGAGPGAIRSGLRRTADGQAAGFTLSIGEETIDLEPGKPWIRADVYKWGTRGVIESPQSYHVLPNGTVEINGEKIAVGDADALARLDHEFNKRHLAPAPRQVRQVEARPVLDHVVFKVRVDHMGHLSVECLHGTEHTETGLRGLPMLAHHGLMVRPESFHIDPLQRWVDLDGRHFECTESGAKELESVLNERYAPRLASADDMLIEVRDNDASPTGFDIHFKAIQAGVPAEVRGHLGQDKLDLLQDQQHCELLKPGILLRLSPPHLLVRRKRPDGGEEKVPELPDISYRRVSAPQLQEVLNHPSIRRGGVARPAVSAGVTQTPAPPASAPASVTTSTPSAPPPMAPPVVAVARPEPAPAAAVSRAEQPPAAGVSKARGVGADAEDGRRAQLARLFEGRDPAEVHERVFARLGECLGMESRTVYLSLPRVFDNRRFDVLALDGSVVEELGDLRSGDFYGFYLSHHERGGVDLVYACGGRHIEWGCKKCSLQASVTAEPEEYPGAALLGLAQDSDDHFAFVVSDAYKQWVVRREADYHRVSARFVTVQEVGRELDKMIFIWPEWPGPEPV